MQDDISGWNEWDAAFNSIEELSSPSELHGILTGIICVTQAPSTQEWEAILDTLQISVLSEEALRLLTEEAEDIASAIHDDELDYLPMLPDDQHLLAERVQALADWCAGVVLGFGLASGHIRQDEAEWIEHLQDVAAVEFTEDDADEAGEEGFNEIYEFVRLIPVSLSTGRKKVAVSETALLKGTALTQKNANVVEMFTPHRPS
ncbi:UPF0149 family protein [Acinetobacter qingfengensis]|uniref:Uncharacterized protein n=1 Tax=Acinetobacter qingfengensis TaxID=1262585 RepID=A0A1E7R938_9GAMM|nr:UPF0149 family protein [Acinetobacter qingfengensis]KAA8735557.1 UPF0149 family protein [Acinetobacter qingfengensis]OEY95795.1 hypothetical protein BJI46_02400 [Acinetobacter qingfengensis]